MGIEKKKTNWLLGNCLVDCINYIRRFWIKFRCTVLRAQIDAMEWMEQSAGGEEREISISQLKYFGRLILVWFQAWKEFFDTKEDLIWFFIEGYKYLPIKLLKIHHENCPKSWKVNDISDNKGKPISPWRKENSQNVINSPNYHKTLTVKISHNLFPNSSKNEKSLTQIHSANIFFRTHKNQTNSISQDKQNFPSFPIYNSNIFNIEINYEKKCQ